MINKEKFQDLKQHKNDSLVSIYIPTEISGDYQKNAIRWKNALKVAKNKLEELGKREDEIKKLTSDVERLVEDDKFWTYQSAGLAAFLSPEKSELINLAYTPRSRIILGEQFITYPLLPTLLSQERIFIMTLSQKNIRFFEVHEHAIFPVKIDDLVPTSMDDLEQVENQSHLQHHQSGETQYHGHAASEEKDDVRVEQLFRYVDKGMKPIFIGEHVPLILAGTKKHQNIYRKVSNYKFIDDFSIDIHPDSSDAVALHTEALPRFKELKVEAAEKLIEKYNYQFSKGLATSDWSKAEKASEYKNIDTLLIHGSENGLEVDEIKMNDLILSAYEQGANIRFISREESEESGIKLIYRFPIS